VIGYLDVERGPWQSADAVLTIHGVYVPRDRYTTDVRLRIEKLILTRFGGTHVETQVLLVAHLHHALDVGAQDLERRLGVVQAVRRHALEPARQNPVGYVPYGEQD
jgi:hypothetical protein